MQISDVYIFFFFFSCMLVAVGMVGCACAGFPIAGFFWLNMGFARLLPP